MKKVIIAISLITVILCYNSITFADELTDLIQKQNELQNQKNEELKKDSFSDIKIQEYETKETKKLKVLYKENVNIVEAKSVENLKDNIKVKVNYTNKRAPIQKGEVIGNITYEYDGMEYKTDLIAGQNVEAVETLKYVLYTLLIVLVIYIIYIIKKSNGKRKKYKKRKVKRIYY